MSYATVMVQLELGRSNAAPLGVALDLAGRTQASVVGVAAAQPIQTAMMADGFYSNDVLREDSDWIDQQARLAQSEFRSVMGGHPDGVDWHMAVTLQPLSERIAAMTGAADIVVSGIDRDVAAPYSPSRRADLGDLIMRTGRPVLAVPSDVHHLRFRTALVAWKDSREARRALTDALPLLKRMQRVVVAVIADAAQQEASQTGLERIVAWLGRHGIAAATRQCLSTGNDGEHLLGLATEEGAELIVAGAYGHSRFREWVLGGVTRTLLGNTDCCLFLSH